MLRAVIFDMDETLIDWSNRVENWGRQSRKMITPVYEYLTEAGYALPPIGDFTQHYRNQNSLAWKAASPPEWRSPRLDQIFIKTLEALRVDSKGINIEEMLRHFKWEVIPGVVPYNDTITVLKTLRKAGLKTGLVTNAALPMWMRDIELESMGLLDLLDERLTAGDVHHLKPHPKPFEVIMERLGVTADEAVFVGDRLRDDVIGAQGVGMRGVWMRQATSEFFEDITPDATLYTLSGLLGELDGWFPGWRENGNA